MCGLCPKATIDAIRGCFPCCSASLPVVGGFPRLFSGCSVGSPSCGDVKRFLSSTGAPFFEASIPASRPAPPRPPLPSANLQLPPHAVSQNLFRPSKQATTLTAAVRNPRRLRRVTHVAQPWLQCWARTKTAPAARDVRRTWPSLAATFQARGKAGYPPEHQGKAKPTKSVRNFAHQQNSSFLYRRQAFGSNI